MALQCGFLRSMVEATGFEPTTSASRTRRSTKLSHASIYNFFTPKSGVSGQRCGQAGFWPRFPSGENAVTLYFQGKCATNALTKRSDGSMLPNAALYQTEPRLDIWNFPPKWSKMWSSEILTEISVRRKCRNSVLWKEMRDKRLNQALPRFYAPEEYELCPLRREWLFIAVSAPQGMLFGGLVSVVSVYSECVYGQICGQRICG